MANETFDFSFLSETEGVSARHFKAGETIFNEGEPATEVYVVCSGRVGIQLGNRLLDVLDADQIFGEMALIDDKPRSATAIALSDVAVIPLSELQFLLNVTRKPAFAIEVMRVLARRLRVADHDLAVPGIAAKAK
jgi:CRP/FNR family transcriptional regulator, cyclic AMP receptor protein